MEKILNYYPVPKSNNQVVQRVYQSGESSPQGIPTIDAPKIIPAEDRMQRLKDIFGEKRLKQMGQIECATCSSRTYVDGSDDPGVSFKTPTSVSPEASFSAVSSHEQEHVVNEQSDAPAENREVVSQSVRIFTDSCPECGRSYASGGVTTTVTASGNNHAEPVERAQVSYGKDTKEKKGNLLDARV